MNHSQQHSKGGYASPQGTRLLQALASDGCYIFEMAELKPIAAKMGISEGQLWVLLHNLEEGGWITRLKKGLYIGTGKLPGEAAAPPFAIATKLAEPSAIGYWSAMSHHGFTEQIPVAVSVMTTKRVYPPSTRQPHTKAKDKKHAWIIDNVRYEYVTVKSQYFFGIEQIWIDQFFRVPITDKERTLLEGFANPGLFGGMGEVLSIMEAHFKEVNLEKLIQYALKYDNISVSKRLGWALEQLKVSSKKLEPLKLIPAKGYRLLDPTRPKHGEYLSQWMLQNNLKAKEH